MSLLHGLKSFFFGDARFDEQEEYLKFCVRFLLANMWFAATVTALLVLIEWLGLNHIGPPHVEIMEIFISLTLSLIILMRGRKVSIQSLESGCSGNRA